MATEFTPELDEKVLQALKRKIQEQEAQQISAAQGMAASRGLTGSTFEATRIGLANKASLDAQTDAMVNMALQRATQQREERLLQEQRTYESGEAQKGRDFQNNQARLNETYQSLENEKQRAYATGENDKARAFEEQQAAINRQFQESLAERESRDSMINAGIQGGAGLLGNIIGRGGGLFGTAASGASGASGATGAASAAAGAGSGLGSMGMLGLGALGYAANVGISSGLGQLVGKGLFKSDQARTGARRGAQIGSILLPGVGGVLGATAGGLASKAGKAVKKLFCFDGGTLIELENGSRVPISAIMLHEKLRDGGEVESIRVSSTADGTRFVYGGVIVTGSHAVKEDGKWVRVKDSNYAKPISGPGIVVSLVTSTHRIFIDGIEFADEHETDDYEILTLDESLACLNGIACPDKEFTRGA